MAELIDNFGARAGHAMGALRDASWQLTVLQKSGVPVSTPMPTDVLGEMAHLLGTVARFCDDLELDSPRDELNRIHAAFNNEGDAVTIEYMSDAIFDVSKRLQDELLRRQFYYIDPAHNKYFREAHEIFSAEALVRFGVASRDIEEASKCFALGRHTACVFHLMRVVEHGMDVLAIELGIVKEYSTWKPKIARMAEVLVEELRKPYDKNSPLAGRMDFFKQATERLTAIQHALRNETMHARSHYGHDDAEDIYRSVIRFMEQLAANLSSPVVPPAAP